MKKYSILYLVTGILIGAVISVPTASAAEEWRRAYQSGRNFYVDGEKVEMAAYAVHENNFVKLRDIGEAVGFNVYWDESTRTVRIETGKPYTGEAPAEQSPDEASLCAEIVDLVNEVRREHGLNALSVSEKLMDAAGERAAICAENGDVSHNKALSDELLAKYGYGHGGAGCNIGWASDSEMSAKELTDLFINSKGHLDTMLLAGAEDIGVGVCNTNGVYVVMYIGNEAWY